MGSKQGSMRASSGKALTQANANLIGCDQIPPRGVEGQTPWNPMSEDANGYQISLEEGKTLKLKSMQISVIRKMICIHDCPSYLKNIFLLILSRKAKASGFRRASLPFREDLAKTGEPSQGLPVWQHILGYIY
jgi:hypothetical protein